MSITDTGETSLVGNFGKGYQPSIYHINDFTTEYY